MEITIDDFDKVEFRAGTIVAVDINKRARKPAYKVTIDLGEWGIKTSSAQLTDLYTAQDLLGRQVMAHTDQRRMALPLPAHTVDHSLRRGRMGMYAGA